MSMTLRESQAREAVVDALLDWTETARQEARDEATRLLLDGLGVESLAELRRLVMEGRRAEAADLADPSGLSPGWVRSARRDEWTPEDFRLVAMYGVCQVCGEPRKSEIRVEGSQAFSVLTCLAGHDVR